MPRLTPSEKAQMFGLYKKHRKNKPAPMTITGEIRNEMATLGMATRKRSTVARWVNKWDDNSGEFTMDEDREYTKERRKVDSKVRKGIKRVLLEEKMSDRRASEMSFVNSKRRRVSVSKHTIASVRNEELITVSPKNLKVILTPHHRKMRRLFAERMLNEMKKKRKVPQNSSFSPNYFSEKILVLFSEKVHLNRILQADESSFGLKILPDPRVDRDLIDRADLVTSIAQLKPWNVQNSDTKAVVHVYGSFCLSLI